MPFPLIHTFFNLPSRCMCVFNCKKKALMGHEADSPHQSCVVFQGPLIVSDISVHKLVCLLNAQCVPCNIADTAHQLGYALCLQQVFLFFWRRFSNVPQQAVTMPLRYLYPTSLDLPCVLSAPRCFFNFLRTCHPPSSPKVDR